MMLAIERQYGKEVGQTMIKDFFMVANSIENSHGDYNQIINNSFYEKEGVAKKFYKITRDRFTNFTMDLVIGRKSPLDEAVTNISNWIETYAAAKVTQVSEHTKEIIRKVISKGLLDGKSNQEIAKDIKDTGKITTAFRAKRISQTEVHTAANTSIHETIGAFNLKSRKEWIDAGDHRVRDIHNGSKIDDVEYDEDFTVGGEQLSYPGDPKGSAKNIVHCRCQALYHTRF